MVGSWYDNLKLKLSEDATKTSSRSLKLFADTDEWWRRCHKLTIVYELDIH